MDATQVASNIAGGKITALQAMEDAISKAKKYRELGAIVEIDAENALTLAKKADDTPKDKRGCFHGVPFLGKDLGSSSFNLTTSGGVLALKNKLEKTKPESELFSRFHKSGLITFGLTAVPEFGLALTSEPPGMQPAQNPWNNAYSPGGSSGGAASAVATGIVPMAHATDAAGSIRIPSACCGLMGLKPSRGTSPGGPEFNNHLAGIAEEFVITRSIRDLKKAFQVINTNTHFDQSSENEKDFSRIGLCASENSSELQHKLIYETANKLRKLNFQVVEMASPEKLGADSQEITRIILTAALAECLDNFEIKDSEISPLTASIAKEGRAMRASTFFSATRGIAKISNNLNEFFGNVDVIISPILSDLPPKLGFFNFNNEDPTSHFTAMEELAPNASLANVSGFPALAMPFGFENGLPIGLQLMSKIGTDLSLLELGQKLDQMHVISKISFNRLNI